MKKLTMRISPIMILIMTDIIRIRIAMTKIQAFIREPQKSPVTIQIRIATVPTHV